MCVLAYMCVYVSKYVYILNLTQAHIYFYEHTLLSSLEQASIDPIYGARRYKEFLFYFDIFSQGGTFGK